MSKTETILDKLQKPKQDEVITDLLVEFREKTFNELFQHLEKIGKLQWFADSKIGDIIKTPQLKKAEEKEETEVGISAAGRQLCSTRQTDAATRREAG